MEPTEDAFVGFSECLGTDRFIQQQKFRKWFIYSTLLRIIDISLIL